MSLFRALHQRSFALLWLGQTFSRAGDFVYEIALAWWVLQKTGSPATLSLVLVFSLAPSVVFALLGGVAVDRFSRPGLMLGSDLIRALVCGLVAALELAAHLEVWHIFVASLVFGLVDAFFQPAYTALVPQLVSESDLPSANALTSLSLNVGRVVGPAVGAGLVAAWGAGWAFGLNALSFLISFSLLIPLLRLGPSGPAQPVARGSVITDLREGFGSVAASPWLWISIVVFALTNITLSGPYSVAMPFLVSQYLHAQVDVLGWLYAIFPLGYIIGGIWLGRYTTLRRRGWVMYGGLVVAALALGLFGFLPPLPVLLIAALINGIALQAGQLVWVSTMQEKVPNAQLGRVASIDNWGSFALLPVGFALTGWATAALGAPLVFILGGGLTALIALIVLFHPAIRQLD